MYVKHCNMLRCRRQVKSKPVVGTVALILVAATYLHWYMYKFQIPMLQSPPVSPREALSDEVTVVTAYFDIGRFRKGEGIDKQSPGVYHEWMYIFKRIHNPLIAFVDNEHSFRVLKRQRSKLPPGLTRIFHIKRRGMWSFGLLSKIARIFQNPAYPKHHPNTVIPEYSSAMHAKYELMSMAVDKNYFKTKYFCWLDVGLFRDDPGEDMDTFKLAVPPRFDVTKVAYTQVQKRNESLTPKQIFYGNMVWVCGCFFFARYDVMAKWTQEYRRFTLQFLEEGLMSTDQQILYSMFLPSIALKPGVSVQTYVSDGKHSEWFYLGYLSKETWEQQNKPKS